MPPNNKEKPITRRELLKSIGALAATSILAACGVRENKQVFIKITMEQSVIQFSPAVVSVPLGATVIWQNMSIYPQSVTCDPSKAPKNQTTAQLPAGAQPWDSGVLYPGQKWSYTFKDPGSYLYFSRYPVQSFPSGLVKVG